MKSYILNGKRQWLFTCKDCLRDCWTECQPEQELCSWCLNDVVDAGCTCATRECQGCGADGTDYLCACPQDTELARVEKALHDTLPKLDKGLLSNWLSQYDAENALRSFGVIL